jgi:hypothetical protein
VIGKSLGCGMRVRAAAADGRDPAIRFNYIALDAADYPMPTT